MMNVRLITQNEIADRQQHLRNTYLKTQNGFTISGIRRLLGSTFIAMGQKIEGRCEQRRRALIQSSPLKPARGI